MSARLDIGPHGEVSWTEDAGPVVPEAKPATLEINVNDYVWVKLTPYGRHCLRRDYDELMKQLGGVMSFEFQPPKEDAEGWSRWQLHDLMAQLGRYCHMGLRVPFETTIRVSALKE